VPAEWQSDITRLPWDVPRHTYYWLTKHPEGLKPFRFGDNSRVGVTVTGPGDLYRQHVLQSVACRVRFISYEPLLAPVEMGRPMPGLPHWLIIGALTRNGRTVPPEQGGTRREWAESLVAQADQAGVPVFMKNNLTPLFPGERLRQEWPHA
jgi:protein gp37